MKTKKNNKTIKAPFNRNERRPLLYNLERLKKDVYIGTLCLDCGWVGVSYSVHDYKTCGCPNGAMIDGGRDYSRYGAMDMKRIQMVNVIPCTKSIKK